MSWEIVLGIIALVGFVGSVAAWVSKLSHTLTSLEMTLKALKEVLYELKDNNKESHKEFYSRLKDHDNRIMRLEASVPAHDNPRGDGQTE